MVVFIKQNSQEVRDKLEKAGFTLCACTEFEGTVWLEYYPDKEKGIVYDIHGAGYTDETDPDYLRAMNPEDRIKEWLTWDNFYPAERKFYDTCDEFLAVYKVK